MKLTHYGTAEHKRLINECCKRSYSFDLEDYESNIVTVDNKANQFGYNEIVDGNHRFAIARENNQLNDIRIFSIDYEEVEKLGFWDNDDNQEEFESWVIATGKLININDCVLPE